MDKKRKYIIGIVALIAIAGICIFLTVKISRGKTFGNIYNPAPSTSGTTVYKTVCSSGCDYTTDGTADNVQIQQALNALPTEGGEVRLSSQAYSISGTIIIPKQSTLSGNGKATKISLANSSSVDMIYTANDLVTIKDLWLSGNSANQATGTAIQIYGSWQSKVQNVYIDYPKTAGVYISGASGDKSSETLVENTEVMSSAGTSFETTDNTQDTKFNSTYAEIASSSCYVVKGFGSEIDNGHAYHCTSNGLYHYGGRLVVLGGVYENNYGNGINFENAQGSSIIGVKVFNNDQAGGGNNGIVFTGTTASSTIEGCQIYSDAGSQDYGIKFDTNVVNNSAVNNKIYGNGDDVTVLNTNNVVLRNKNGYFGIGTSNPAYALDISNGNVFVKPDSTWSSGDEANIYLGSTDNYVRGKYASGLQINSGGGANDPIKFAFGSTEAARLIDSSGTRLGIRDTSPDFGLEVGASTTLGYFAVSGGNQNGSGDGDIFIVNGARNVGIGTTTPSEKLVIGGNVLADDYLEFSPIFTGEALSKIVAIKEEAGTISGDWAEVDHDTLPDEVRYEKTYTEQVQTGVTTEEKVVDGKTVAEEKPVYTEETKTFVGRNLGHLVQLIQKGVKELYEISVALTGRMEKLESDNALLKTELCKKDNTYAFCK